MRNTRENKDRRTGKGFDKKGNGERGGSSRGKKTFNKSADKKIGRDKNTYEATEDQQSKRFDNKDKRTEFSRGKDRFSKASEGGRFDKPKSGKRFDKPRKDNRFDKKKNEEQNREKEARFGKEERQGIRLNKYIAQSGMCSRREADVLISSGAVTVNGKAITEMGAKIQPGDKVQVGGERLKTEPLRYVLLNKPKDYITTTTDDPKKRRKVTDLIADACRERLYPVGRLDRMTSGLLLFTNDGEVAKKMTQAKSNVKMIFHVELDQPFAHKDLDKVKSGVLIDNELVNVIDIAYISPTSKKELGIEIHTGKNRVIKDLFEHLGYKVTRLDRAIYAGLTKKNLPRAKWRFLSEQEINYLRMNIFNR